MHMTKATKKAERLLQVETLLLDHPRGLKQAEIARRLGVNRSTIHRYLPELTDRFAVYEEDDGRLVIDRDHYLTRVRLTLHEALALHLAARLMATRTDKHNPHGGTALRKLSLALERLAPLIARHLSASADVMDDAARRHDPVYLEVLETLTRAWSQGQKVRLWHRLASGEVYDYVFAPYFVEPYAVGQTTHVIGWRDPPKAVRTFKLERIQRIELLDEEYTIPEDFEPRALLADAWGIWYTEAEPVEVALRFHPRVAPRVRETRWHASERVEEQPDGSLVWRARVAEPQEMLPWIRGWGADVEVLAPEELREALVKETRRLAMLYQVGSVEPPPLYQGLWAKAEKSSGKTHPLICHMLDVGGVALAMWNEVLTESIRTQLAEALGLDQTRAGNLIAFWAALHDLGKATPAFQEKYEPARITLTDAGLPFPKSYGRERFYHGTATSRLLPDLLAAETNTPRRWRKGVALAVGGHHGAWPIPAAMQGLKPYRLGDGEWEEIRADLVRAVRELLAPEVPADTPLPREAHNALLTLLSGLASVADWVGSMEHYFPFVEPPIDLTQYAERAQQQALEALQDLRWTAWTPPTEEWTFTELFQLPSPRPMQSQVIALAEQLQQPSLVIIEAPTGVGKTEAALYLADHWARVLQQRGLYIAMPTMATSNQMFDRVGDVMERRYPDTGPQVLLIHSQARWSQNDPPRQVNIAREVLENEDEQESVNSMAWFLPRKRSLLAPFGVGTVDQTFLSVLQTRHFFVRLFGLSHKTLIFDEVHAYDTYMSTLFQRLLGWLRVVGASVIILSATLSEKTRCELVRAYTGNDEMLAEASYPGITWASGGEIGMLPLQAPQSRSLTLEWLTREPRDIVHTLQAELREGGCAAVICNTVGRAQEVYRALCKANLVPEEDLSLFHARFPQGWRQKIEARVLSDFGKNGQRPEKAIVVATQVIEQSLDLDFDVMISDLAPVDLLLQRAGRLHRHDRDVRPAPLAAPRLFVTAPDLDKGVLNWGSDAYIYEPYVLLRSYLVLQGREQIKLPSDTVSLIEGVYGPDEPDAGTLVPALVEARQRMHRDEEKARDVARGKLIKPPQADNLLRKSNASLAEEAPEIHDAFRALTRLSRPSLSVVCLHRIEGKDTSNTEPDGNGSAVDLEEKPDAELTESLVNATVSLSHGGIFPQLVRQERPSGWRNHTLLKDYRVAIFEDGVCPLKDCAYTLILRRDTGLEIVKHSD
jgi:CRISPR-associated endonuclease/helicase Cas3